MKMKGVSPLTTLYVEGKKNTLTDIPSRLFGSEPKWHCVNDSDFLKLFNREFPLPNTTSWTVFRPTSKNFTKVLSVLQMKVTTMDEWRRLPKAGTFTGDIGASSSHLWEWTLRFRESHSESKSDASRALAGSHELATSVAAVKSKLGQSVRRSLPFERKSLWPTG